MGWGELFSGIPLGRGKFLIRGEQHAIVVATNAQHVSRAQKIGCSCWVKGTSQVISQIHDLLNASLIYILQDCFQCPTIPMHISNDSKRGLKDLILAHGSLFSQRRSFSGKCTISLLLLCKRAHFEREPGQQAVATLLLPRCATRGMEQPKRPSTRIDATMRASRSMRWWCAAGTIGCPKAEARSI